VLANDLFSLGRARADSGRRMRMSSWRDLSTILSDGFADTLVLLEAMILEGHRVD
jgi:hypothetical protein